MAEDGADAVIAHLGITPKGSIGATTATILQEAPAKVQELCDAAKSVNPDVITLCHGGPLSMLDDIRGVDGFYGASSRDRLQTEIAINEQMQRFKTIRFQVPRP